ncbi:MAG: flavin reductase, partial [Bacteroidales bacterium]|nr:flavin reductase [Bacteroidales bacterium]
MSDALYNIEYGLFVITAREGEKDNGCISNSVIQVSSGTPQTIAVSMNKKNFTHDMIVRTNLLNVSILTKEVPMNVISHFGFQSGRDVNKFEK